jgi:IS4 transposase
VKFNTINLILAKYSQRPEEQEEPGKTVQILINDFEMTAQEIGNLYLKRWQIELFFK